MSRELDPYEPRDEHRANLDRAGMLPPNLERREAEFYVQSADRGRRWSDAKEPDWDDIRDRRDDV